MQTGKNAGEAVKEKVSNVTASARAGLEKTKATLEEKAEKMTTRDPLKKELATERKEERKTEAEIESSGHVSTTPPRGKPAPPASTVVTQQGILATAETTGYSSHPAGDTGYGGTTVYSSHPTGDTGDGGTTVYSSHPTGDTGTVAQLGMVRPPRMRLVMVALLQGTLNMERVARLQVRLDMATQSPLPGIALAAPTLAMGQVAPRGGSWLWGLRPL
ncbi:18 kDa seed maturation protein [Vitis vinifera]|uniref:18 kDa seed maturation protein n=1 Tax=Vitis vinifera TaxID=29760 RepID=A0A438D5N0_VITVI|nr:18 kDa seed maturation protein [Vitis vinifera]